MQNYNIDNFNKLVKKIEVYFAENTLDTTPVVNYLNAKELAKEIDFNFGDEQTRTIDQLINDYLKFAVRTTHPNYNNQLNGGFTEEGLIGEVLSYITDTSMSTFEISPMATIIENSLISYLNTLIGFRNSTEEADGIMLTGGSNANMMAIHLARHKYNPKIKYEGMGIQKLHIYVSAEAHYSFQKAVLLLGMGLDSLIAVKSDKEGRMSPLDLETKIKKSIEMGAKPLLIASTAGTTVFGAFDPIENIQKIANQYSAWHHVDGAWGGAALFSEKLKNKLKGLSSADSFTFDAHKLLGTGLVTSFFLTAHKDLLEQANSAGGQEYLFHQSENSDYDLGKKSLQCGRKADSLKLWILLGNRGLKAISSLVEGQFEKAAYFSNQVRCNPQFKLIHNPESLNVCFQVIPKDKNIDINDYNVDLRFRLTKEGEFMVNYSVLNDGTAFFRFVFSNNMTENSDSDKFLAKLSQMIG